MRIIEEFKEFALRGNLMEMAVGFTVGAAFTSIAKSFINDIVMPPLGLFLGRADFKDLFIVIKTGQTELPASATLEQAQTAAAVTINYGAFTNNVLAFVLVTIVMFMFIRLLNKLDKELDERLGEDEAAHEQPTEKKCPFCRSIIAHQATRCPLCTSQLEDAAAE